MEFLDGLEKLINEHGSAAILKERIELANDKYAALETRATSLEAENKTLRTSLETAELALQDLRSRSEQASPARFESSREAVLLAVAKFPGRMDSDIAGIAEVSELLATHHLQELQKLKMVSVSITLASEWANDAGGCDWTVSQPGLSYLVKYGLVT